MGTGELVATQELLGGRRLTLVHGDLTTQDVDAIVNAANEQLAHGGGVAGAIVRAGGPSIQEESDRIGRVPTGSAAITGAGRLPARHVIHAVGPIWRGGGAGEERLLASAVSAALRCAEEHQLTSVALPGISTGIYGYPKAEGARVIIEAIRAHAASSAGSLREIRLTMHDRESVEVFRAAGWAPGATTERRGGD